MRLLRIGAVVAGVALTVLGASPAMAAPEQPSGPVGPRIIDGDLAKSGPWAARQFNDGREACSSTIIAPKWILTAQHCVDGAGELTFHIGNLDQTQGEKATGVKVHESPDADLALVELDHEVQATYSPLGNPGDAEVGETVQLYGWGATCTDKPEIECQSQHLKVANTEVTAVDGSCQDYRGGKAVCVKRGDGIAAGGDSGGPMFAKNADGKDVQVGVASTSDRQTRSTYGNITQYRDWVKSIAGV
ncbi:trypsin [Herbihabitans rhizosphaerae]|uniref:Trypsin n=1 Tax=Herbihabitans rhizosphaerae TaxID=1872711 RepID=A0A4Q7KGQ6_9PSEU|nr:trypsin-like serine protease [Herbihabitans rhizosphaerae]RZS34040.1 trypsin [Herbihabitans rhizosphaerae]